MLAPKLIPSSNVSEDFTASIFRVFKKSRIPKEGNYHYYSENIQSFTALRVIIIIIIYLTANGLSPGGSGYNACT